MNITIESSVKGTPPKVQHSVRLDGKEIDDAGNWIDLKDLNATAIAGLFVGSSLSGTLGSMPDELFERVDLTLLNSILDCSIKKLSTAPDSSTYIKRAGMLKNALHYFKLPEQSKAFKVYMSLGA